MIEFREIKRLIKRLKEIRKLGKTGSPEAAGLLVKALKDKRHFVRRYAAVRLYKAGWKPANNKELAYYCVARRLWTKTLTLGRDAVEPLLNVIDDEKKTIRLKAIEFLGKIAGQVEVPAAHFAGAVSDRDTAVREKAVEALEEINDAATAVLLTTALEDENAAVRVKAVEALGKKQDTWAIVLLIDAMKDRDHIVAELAGETLKNMLTSGALRHIPVEGETMIQLFVLLRDEDPTVRSMAIMALSKADNPEVIDPLVTALHDEDYRPRRKAAAALRNVTDERSVAPLIDALEDEDLPVRGEAAESLLTLAGAGMDEPIAQALGHENALVREKIAAILDKIIWQPGNDGECARYLIAKQEWDKLAQAGEAAVVPLIHLLDDKEKSIRVKAASVLGDLRDPLAVEALIAALHDGYPEVRRAAAKALGKIGHNRAAKPLIHLLKDDGYEVRRWAAAALIRIGQIEDKSPLIALLKDRSSNTRRAAAEVLGKSGWQPEAGRETALYFFAAQQWDRMAGAGDGAIEVLLGMLKDEEAGIRESVIDALGEVGDSRIIEPLLMMLNDPSPFVRGKSVQVLDDIFLKVINEDMNLLCLRCFLRYRQNVVYYPENSHEKNLAFYACPNCHSDRYFSSDAAKVVILLDRDLEGIYTESDAIVTINWFKKEGYFDYDEIRIDDADDYQVEKFVMKLVNDTNKERRKRLPEIPVFLSPGLKLSPAKLNLLKDNFQVHV